VQDNLQIGLAGTVEHMLFMISQVIASPIATAYYLQTVYKTICKVNDLGQWWIE